MQGSPGAASCRTAVLHTRRETLSNTLTSPPPEESHPKMETQVAGSYRKAHPAGVRAACGLGQRRRAGGQRCAPRRCPVAAPAASQLPQARDAFA